MSYLNPINTRHGFGVYTTSTGKDDVPSQKRVLLKTIENSCKITRKLSITENNNSNIAGACQSTLDNFLLIHGVAIPP